MDFLEKLSAKKIFLILILTIITLLVYFPVMRGGYVLDDDHYIVENQNVHDLNHVKQIFTQSVDGMYYRPNVFLGHAIIYSLFGSGAPAHHLFSIFIHVLNVILVFILLGLLGFSNLSSLIASIIFAIHPINTEAVAYISALSDPLSMLFILGSAIFYVCYRKTNLLYHAVFTLFSVLLALFTKESSMMIFAILILIEIYLQPKKIKIDTPGKVLLGITLLISVVFIYFRFTAFSFAIDKSGGPVSEYNESLWIRFVTFCTVIPTYFFMLIYPAFQFYGKSHSFYTSLQTLGFGGLMLMGALGYLFFTSRTNNKPVMLSIGVFFMFLIPVSGIIPLNDRIMDGWLYLPFLGISVAIASLLDKVSLKIKPFVFLFFGVLFLIYGVKTFNRNIQWADPITFYKNEIKYNKNSPLMYSNLAMALFEKKDYFSAINYYNTAISLYDVYPQTHHNLALTYMQLNQISNAIAEEYKALELQTDFLYSLNSLQTIYTKLKDQKRAENFSKYIQQAESGKKPDWNEIKENLHADK